MREDGLVAKDRLVVLDILRGCAILGVFAMHWYFKSFDADPLPWNGDWPAFDLNPYKSFRALYFLSLGGAGVPLFFVLSGFCIHLAVIKQGKKYTIASFYWKRFWRIYPAYLFALSFCIVLQGWPGWPSFTTHLLFIHNWFVSKDILCGINASFWTLPVEFQLYLLYPLFLLVSQRLSIKHALAMTAIVTLLFQFVLPGALPGPLGGINLGRLPFAYWLFWGLGAYIADAYVSNKTAFSRHALIIAVLIPLFFLTGYYRPLATNTWAWIIRSLLFAFILDAALTRSFNVKRKLLSVLSFIGVVSYSLYLFHEPLISRLNNIILDAFNVSRSAIALLILCFPFTLAVLVLISWYSWKFSEMRSVEYGKWLWSKLTKANR